MFTLPCLDKSLFPFFPAGHLNSSDAHAGHAMIFEVAMMTNQVHAHLTPSSISFCSAHATAGKH